jgi:hypothetical protein
VGSQVTVSIAAVDASMKGQYVIVWNDTPIAEHGSPVILSRGYLANGNSAFTAQVTIPESPFGNYYISFLPENGSARTNFQFNLQPAFDVSSTSVKPGDTIQLKGTGFPADEKVSIYLNGVTMDVNVTANMKGSFYQAVKIPPLDPGQYKLAATNENRGINKSVNLVLMPPPPVADRIPPPPPPGNTLPPPPVTLRDTMPPAMPVPQAPMGDNFGYFGEQTITFKWSDVSDTEKGPVRYALEVCTDPQSTAPVLKANDLQANFYSISVKPGTYYWKVKAIDNSGNESDWRFATYPFQVSEGSVLWDEFTGFMERTRIFVMVLWAIGIYILVSVVIFFIRKMKKWQSR